MMRIAAVCLLLVNVLAESSVDITYGSAIKLGLEGSKTFLRSFDVQWNGRSRNGNIVTTVADETNPEIYWVVTPSTTESNSSGDVVKCGSRVRFAHAITGKELAADLNQRSNVAGLNEVTAVSGNGDEFVVECEATSGGMWGGPGAKEKWEKGDKVQLKHVTGGYLKSSSGWVYNQHNCARCPMVGDWEVVVTKDSSGGSGTYWVVEGGVIVRNPAPEEPEQEDDEKGKDEL